MEIGNVTKAATFKTFFHQSYKNIQLLFLWQCFLTIFMRQILTDDFWQLHKNKNERSLMSRSGVFINFISSYVNFEQISHIILVFPLFTLSM